MWFVSGLVLIYYPFPGVATEQVYENMDVLPDSLPPVEALLSRSGTSDKNLKNLEVSQFQGQTLLTKQVKDGKSVVCIDSSQSVNSITAETLEAIAQKWVGISPSRIDTLNEREIWIMYSRYDKEMPIYKMYFDDDGNHQLYVSSKTGEVLQFTDRSQRFWAWVGAIPHKLYIPALRKNTDTWISTLTVLATVAFIAAFSGMYIGVYAMYRRYKSKHKLGSPYKKWWHKWHHLTGLVFGVFLITFAFSGAMAMQKIPQWIIKTHGDYRVSDSKLRGKSLSIDKYKLDYRKLKDHYPQIKSIKWIYFQGIPIYNVVDGNNTFSIDASSNEVRELDLSYAQIAEAIENLYGRDIKYSVSLIDEYEEYYMSRKRNLPLPVYKVTVDNEDESLFYIDPSTGNFKYLNRTTKAKKWIFSGLHYLNIKVLIDKPILWTILIWVLCLGGGFVSLSGIYLGFKYTVRRLKYLQKRIKNT